MLEAPPKYMSTSVRPVIGQLTLLNTFNCFSFKPFQDEAMAPG